MMFPLFDILILYDCLDSFCQYPFAANAKLKEFSVARQADRSLSALMNGISSRQSALLLPSARFSAAKHIRHYLDFSVFFLSSVALGVLGFCPIHPQPQFPFLSAILITSFLVCVHRFRVQKFRVVSFKHNQTLMCLGK